MRDSNDVATMARMNSDAILTPSGRSMTLSIVASLPLCISTISGLVASLRTPSSIFSDVKLFQSPCANRKVGYAIACLLLVSFRDYHDEHSQHHGRNRDFPAPEGYFCEPSLYHQRPDLAESVRIFTRPIIRVKARYGLIQHERTRQP